VIWESHPWHGELCRVAEQFEHWSRSVDWDDEVAFKFERDVMVSAYALRKLLEARKLTDTTVSTRLRVEAFPLLDHIPDLMNWHRLEGFYDFRHVQSEDLTLVRLCNQLIHSFIFMPETTAADDDRGESNCLAGFCVASDRVRASKLYRIQIGPIIRLLRSVGEEEVISTQMIRDKSDHWQVSNKTAIEMDHAEPGQRRQSPAEFELQSDRDDPGRAGPR